MFHDLGSVISYLRCRVYKGEKLGRFYMGLTA